MLSIQSQLQTLSSKLHARRGIASLPVVLLFGGIIIEIAVTGAFLLFYLNNSIYGTKLSNEALITAQAGVDDAVLKIILNKMCPDAGCLPSGPTYTLSVGRGSASVTIERNAPVTGKHRVTSVGTVLTKQHQLIAVIDVDESTGLSVIDSITDEPL
jgi:hypothetical protein